MKILIIGKTGQLGNALIEKALSLNYTIIDPPRSEIDITKIKDNCKFFNLLKDNKPDVVINTAAYNEVLKCESNQIYSFDVNCFAVKNMAEMTDKLNIPFISFSTDYVFNGKRGYPYTEIDNPCPINMYGISKLAGEYASLIYDNTTIIRTCGLYGLKSLSTKGAKGNFVDNRVSDSKTKEFITVGYDQTVSPTFVNDLSDATLQLIEHPIKKYRLYHLVNEGYCTWHEFTKEIYDILDIDIEVIPVNRHGLDGIMKRPLFSALINERGKELGITLPHWRDALRRYLELKYKIKMD